MIPVSDAGGQLGHHRGPLSCEAAMDCLALKAGRGTADYDVSTQANARREQTKFLSSGCRDEGRGGQVGSI